MSQFLETERPLRLHAGGQFALLFRVLVFRPGLHRRDVQWRGLKASGGCQSPDLSRMIRKSGHLRTPLAFGIP